MGIHHGSMEVPVEVKKVGVPVQVTGVDGEMVTTAVAARSQIIHVALIVNALRSYIMDVYVREGIVPAVFRALPTELLEMRFASGASVYLGGKLKLTDVSSAPTYVNWPPVMNGRHLYTLVLLNIDVENVCRRQGAPPPPEWHHWLVVNIAGTGVVSARTLAAYSPPHPSHNTGICDINLCS